MKKVDKDFLNKINDDDYVWYLCYGSNININRLMIYINGDKKGRYAAGDGCKNKSKPVDSKPYIIRRAIYFAEHSGTWNGGVAFLNYRVRGKTYGKIYKVTKSQFLDIMKQENRFKAYDTLIYVGKYRKTPIFTFTALHKLQNMERPSKQYLTVIKRGIRSTYKRLSDKTINNYIKRISNIKDK